MPSTKLSSFSKISTPVNSCGNSKESRDLTKQVENHEKRKSDPNDLASSRPKIDIEEDTGCGIYTWTFPLRYYFTEKGYYKK